MEEFWQQRPQKTLQDINSFYIKHNEGEKINVPEYIILEWELINLIIDYNLMLYSDINYDEYFSFTSKEIKDYYEKINNHSKKFNKIYGKNGVYMILAYRNGVKYEIKNDTWYIYPKPFLKYILQFYEQDKEIYGKDFDKPFKKKIYKYT